jgi:hypothetical protein
MSSIATLPVAASADATLVNRAMLCNLDISQFGSSKYDQEISDEVAEKHGAEADAGRYRKNLFPRQALKEIRKLVRKTYVDHREMTLPWNDTGYRILPSAMYIEHNEKMRADKAELLAAVTTFAKDIVPELGTTELERWINAAKTRLGGMFRASDYPTAEEFIAEFDVEQNVIPLPDANDFRVTLGDEEKDRIKRQITASVEASLTLATRELWQRTYDAVSHMADKLRTYKAEEGSKTRLHDSVVNNLVKLCDVMPKMNLAKDPELDRLTAEIRASLLVNPDTLRNSESVRTDTARAAAQIAERMAGYMGDGFLALAA